MDINVNIAGDLERIRLDPGDRLVFTVESGTRLTLDDSDQIKRALENELGCPVLIIGGGSLSVVGGDPAGS
jgi:hypothetical protein